MRPLPAAGEPEAPAGENVPVPAGSVFAADASHAVSGSRARKNPTSLKSSGNLVSSTPRSASRECGHSVPPPSKSSPSPPAADPQQPRHQPAVGSHGGRNKPQPRPAHGERRERRNHRQASTWLMSVPEAMPGKRIPRPAHHARDRGEHDRASPFRERFHAGCVESVTRKPRSSSMLRGGAAFFACSNPRPVP